jgi:hypothetical protein
VISEADRKSRDRKTIKKLKKEKRKVMKAIRYFFICVLGIFTALSFVPAPGAQAGEVGVLINKLIQRGILSESDGRELLREIQDEEGRQEQTVREIAAQTASKEVKKQAEAGGMEIPQWVKHIKFKGDFRLRYQDEDTQHDEKESRDRYRIRWRFGAESKVNDQWKAGFGLASGSGDPRSTNQTLENTFQTPDARLDFAYAEYTPFPWVNLYGGKFKNPIWGPKDLLWDGDIRPDGAAASLRFKLEPAEIFITPAYFILDEYSADKDDPAMALVQAGANVDIGKAMYFKVAGTYYNFVNVTGNSFEYSAGTNSVDAAGKLTQNYDSLAGDAELGINLSGPVPMVAVFGQYVKSDADAESKGWLVGFKFGHKKVSDLGQWQVKYNYRKLEKDAWPDFLPDSDFYGGSTNVKGNEVELALGLAKHVEFGIDYYFDVKPINGATDRKQKVLQADLILKW